MYSEVLELLPVESPAELPAELHGLVCGALCAGIPLDEARWRELTEFASAEVPAEEVDAVLFVLLRGAQGLDAEDFAFEPLLPDEETPIWDRLRALAAWCDAFVFAFGMANPDLSLVSEDAAEAIGDLEQVADVDPDVAAGEEEERQYVEVREHVKAAALLIREELRDTGEA